MRNAYQLSLALVAGSFLAAPAAHAEATYWQSVDARWAQACQQLNGRFKAQAVCTIDHKSFDAPMQNQITGDACVEELSNLGSSEASVGCAADASCAEAVRQKLKQIDCKAAPVRYEEAHQEGSRLTIVLNTLSGSSMNQISANFRDYVYVLAPDYFWKKQEVPAFSKLHAVCNNDAKFVYDRESMRLAELNSSANREPLTYCTDFVLELMKLCNYHEAPKAQNIKQIVCAMAKPGAPQAAKLDGSTLRLEFRIVNGNFIPNTKPNAAYEVIDNAMK